MTETLKTPIVPKGKLTKTWAVVLSLLTAPDLVMTVLGAGQKFTEGTEQYTTPTALAVGQLVSVLGVIYGIIRRTWLK